MSTTDPPNSPSDTTPIHLTLPLPLSPHTSLRALIHPLQTPLIFLTTTTPTSSPPSALGTFVYALPNRLKPSEPLCTVLYGSASGVDFASRVAKVLTKRLGKPVYVGWSGELGGVGGQMDEEMEGLRRAIEALVDVLSYTEAESRDVNGEG